MQYEYQPIQGYSQNNNIELRIEQRTKNQRKSDIYNWVPSAPLQGLKTFGFDCIDIQFVQIFSLDQNFLTNESIEQSLPLW